jgi:protein-disulfide isomerase-like protein with CxxC motif
MAKAYPQGAPIEVQATADHLWKLAADAAALDGAIERLSSATQRLVEGGDGFRAEVIRQIEAAEGAQRATLREQLDRYNEALEEDLQNGRENMAARVREAVACEVAFKEASGKLLEHLRDKPECRDLLEAIEAV